MYRRAPNDCLCTFLSPTLLSASGGVKRERKKLKKLPWEWLVFIKEREREYKEDKPFHSPLSMQKREKEKKHGLTFKVFSTSFPGALAHLWVRVLLFFLLLLTGWHQMLPPFPFFLSLLIVRPTAGRPLEDVLLCPCRFPSRTPRSMLMGDLYIIGLTKRWCQYQISEEGESCAISPSIPLLSVEYGAYCMSGWIRQTSWITRWSSWGPP